eukprot:4005254-Pleurochrysis_carterae.AAC.1
MPMGTAAVTAFAETLMILALRVGSLGVAFRAGLVLLGLAKSFGFAQAVARQKCAAIRPVQFKIALNFSGLGGAQNVANRFDSERQIAGGRFEFQLDVQ